MAEARIEAELPELLISSAILAGATPRAIEIAITERGADHRNDPLVMLVRETGVPLQIVVELVDRWGIKR